ncbi:MAG: membrane dipeptidase [Desulfobacteraceae bacterium]|nr:membrane dipeptidase [Desulfobacteraceae bacterium]
MEPILVFDGHNDSLLARYLPAEGKAPRDFTLENQDGHIDFPRAERGGFGGGLFAVFVPSPKQKLPHEKEKDDKSSDPKAERFLKIGDDYAREMTLKGIRTLKAVEAESDGRLKQVATVKEIRRCMDSGVIGAVLHFEGAESIDAGLTFLPEYYEAGLRSVGLVWSRENAFGVGVDLSKQGSPNTGPGLTDAGKALVGACNDMGIMVDLSHLNEPGFWDVEKISTKPLVATHSCVYALCPNPRNLTDKQLDAVAASGGVVGINFCVSFLRKDGKNEANTPLSVMVDHFKYVADRIGVEHVAIGSDFDGALIPDPIKDVAGLPCLLTALADAGFGPEELAKIAHENWLRVLAETWA